tara:strand:- start:1099 stop:1467 length:369 start_codon:yes stop_codon:yes gene_type:complete
MTSKEVVSKVYECFGTGDMETLASLFHEDSVTKLNGTHKMSGTFIGPQAWIENLSKIPELFDNFSITPVHMIAEGNEVFVQLHATADGMEADFGHFFKLLDGKVKQFWVYDDSQKISDTMKS